MTPIEMHYSWVSFVCHATVWFGQRLAEKWFDVVLALLGTLLGYWLAKLHLEHFVSGIVAKMDAKHLNFNRQIAFSKAVSAMLPELPQFYMRPTSAFSSHVATAVGEFTFWSAAIDPAHTPEKSMELAGKEAYTAAAGLIQKDMGFKEAVSMPNHEWQFGVGGLPVGWTVEEVADLSIYNWDTGAAIYRYARMKEVARTADSILYNWMWDTKDVPCGVYVGVVNFTIGGTANAQYTASPIGERLKIFFKREKDQIIKTHESIPW